MTQPPPLDQLCCQACGLVQSVGDWIAAQRGQVASAQIERKALNSLVSFVDRGAETQLVQGLGALLPESGFYTEEETIAKPDASAEWVWIIDPLDGTTNFLHQIPFFSVSVALQQRGQTVLGIVYDPCRKELFYSWEGGGVFLNGHVIRVTDTARIGDALVATGFPYTNFEKADLYLRLFERFMREARGLRRLGSAALDLAYVACGRFDGFFEYGLSPWDVAAGVFLVQQAGGQTSTWLGKPDCVFGDSIVATNGALHRAHLHTIQTFF